MENSDDRLGTLRAKAAELARLHEAPEILTLVNVWDAVSARVVGALPQTRALATASHSIALAHGYPDGERIPLELMLTTVGRIVAATELPVTADLEAGYGDAGETVRRAIDLGVVGANIEDGMRALTDAAARVRAVGSAAEAAGIPFVLNARTDAVLRAGDRPRAEVIADAAERGSAFLDEGATCVFVPGALDEAEVADLVAALGERRLSVIGGPGSLPAARLQSLGVARVSYGPWPQRVALTALQRAAEALYAGEGMDARTQDFG
ncbi:MAG TPA: isocitrate lyase/phosphoenolpyruvate mutase family protein [Humibacter sp.]|nr:isocitrate lyase/phosphoenolpyruvate mutase family protein [Humibacter sp.]